ncbi:alpha/beta fold hydrolase [Woodsholea maritima]|uniref:alpha/beta fold hydrolase n=1 Tax=Woodsholea maritima TaxID=240237 RepID=UPI000381C3C3|nr:alpha/beta hydrolase [Woodsholea maritima]
MAVPEDQNPPLVNESPSGMAAPEWFTKALKTPFETGHVTHKGIDLAWKAWGKKQKNCIILIHGGTAHKGWWDAMGPFLAQNERRVVAIDLAGMGHSGWREGYDLSQHGEDALIAAEAGGAFAGEERPVLVGHSFGGFVTMMAAIEHGKRLSRAIILDSPFRPLSEQRSESPPRRGGRVYATIDEALARFRLLPEQACENTWLVDYIARGSLHPVEGGYTWHFDPQLWQKLSWTRQAPEDLAKALRAPLAFIRGAQSDLVPDPLWTYMQGVFKDSPFIDVPEARHHLILDQPLAVIAALNALIEGWKTPRKD